MSDHAYANDIVILTVFTETQGLLEFVYRGMRINALKTKVMSALIPG